MTDYLMHIGRGHLDGGHSGRYPYGYGDDTYQHQRTTLQTTVDMLRKQGMTKAEIASHMGMSTSKLVNRLAIDNQQEKAYNIGYVMWNYFEKGLSKSEIARNMNMTEGNIRHIIKQIEDGRTETATTLKSVVKDIVDELKYVDCGPGSEILLGVTATKLNAVISSLEDDGYFVDVFSIPQPLIPGAVTNVKIIAPPGTTRKDVREHQMDVKLMAGNRSYDGGYTFKGIKTPANFDSKRLQVVYAEDGGKNKDGVIELRRGVDELSLGNANYAQVRIAVDGTHYLKGMAVYSDDLPPGVDIRFNTNKHKGTPVMGPKNNTVLKPLKDDPENPFGTTLRMENGIIIGQREYTDKNGETKLSPVNIVKQEGDWGEWSKTLSQQFLSKQPYSLINQQLNLSYQQKIDEFKDILSISQPEVRKILLDKFSEDCESSAVDMKAASLPRQSTKVILPLTSIKDDEVYAPGYKNGEKVALVRFPHEGQFAIPILTVNNHNKEGGNVITPLGPDAVGISAKVAERLSGADFDGDTVVVIPTSGQNVKNKKPLKELEDFDTKEWYGPHTYEGRKVKLMAKKEVGKHMGIASNLITDMTIRGASDDELARAVMYSMVVIDAEKHNLDYMKAYQDNRIEDLKKRYQQRGNGKYGGASTLLSKRKQEIRIPEREKKTVKERSKEDQKWFESVEGKYDELSKEDKVRYTVVKKQMTSDEYQRYLNGEEIFYNTEKTHWTEKGEKANETKVPAARLAKDAYELSSGSKVESYYAEYSNKLKALANEARKESIRVPKRTVDPIAKETYKEEVKSLSVSIETAKANKPYERQAQLIANTMNRIALKENPDLRGDDSDSKAELKKIKIQNLAGARRITGANRSASMVKISEKEWEAINAGALTPTKVREIVENTDMDELRKLATPRTVDKVPTYKANLIRNMAKSGYTLDEIATQVGMPSNEVSNVLKGVE